MQEITVTYNDAGRRLDRYLEKLLPGAGLSFLYRMLRKKNITVNGSKADGRYKLKEGDVIRMFFADETYAKFAGDAVNAATTQDENTQKEHKEASFTYSITEYAKAYSTYGQLDIIYEDDDFIFIDKPAGVLSQKADRDDISLNEWLIGYLLDKGEITIASLKTFKPAFANRLDRNTSGLMLGGKTLRALQYLGEQLRGRSIHKFYLCLAAGCPDEALPANEDKYIDIYGYLIKDRERNTVCVYDDMESAKAHINIKNAKGRMGIREADHGRVQRIHTGFRLIKAHTGTDTNKESMLLEVRLYTGRSHQIRAQLSHLGHPVIGDPKYSTARHTHQALHAYRVVFPETEEYPYMSGREFKTKLPDFI